MSVTNDKTQYKLGLNYVYFIRENNSPYVKIGFSNDPQGRLSELQVGNPHDLEIIHCVQVADPIIARNIEAAFKRRYNRVSIRGEWYMLSGHDWEDVKLIMTIANESAKAERKRWRGIVSQLWTQWRDGGEFPGEDFSLDDTQPAWLQVTLD